MGSTHLRQTHGLRRRGTSVYEEVHEQKYLANPKVHRRFIHAIQAMLPVGCEPIVMTDAGFHAPWLKMIAALGWQFIGRVRGRNGVCLTDGM